MDGRQRLERLLVVLKQVDDSHFNQNEWGEAEPHPGESEEDWDKILAQHGFILGQEMPETLSMPIKCHTEACTLGWAALDPVLQAEGLAWRRYGQKTFGGETTDPFRFYDIRAEVPGEVGFMKQITISEFFDIGRDAEAEFFGGGHANLYQKIQQIQRYLDLGELREAQIFPKYRP